MDLKDMLQIQVKALNSFIDVNVRLVPISKDGTVHALVGRLIQPAGLKAIHAYIFPKGQYTAKQAEAYIESNKKDSDKTARLEEKFLITKIEGANETDASFWATASTDSPDRMGDVIHAEGWDLTNFKKNPVIQPFHDYKALPVAKAVDIYVRDNTLRFKPQFAVDIPKYDLPGIMYNMYKGGFMNAFSVGFDPKKWAFTDPDNWMSGIEYFEQELLEISAVPVPCHPDALMDPQYQRMMKAWAPGVTLPVKDTPAVAPEQPEETPPAPPESGNTPVPAAPPVETPPAAPAEPVPPAPATEPEPQDPSEKSVFMPILNVKNVDELYEIASILKTRRIISDRNRSKIQGALKELDRTREALTALLKLTEAKSPVTGGDGGNKDVAAVIDSLKM